MPESHGFGLKNAEGRLLLEFCDQQEFCAASARELYKENNKLTFGFGKNTVNIGINFVS